MNLQQLRIIRETVRRNFNLTEVATALFTSQSGVSKHILDLEDELGVQLFVRRGKRLTGLTGPGEELVPIVERILLDLGNIRSLADHYAQRDEGTLRIATTHTQARYALPAIVAQFRAAYPQVHLHLHQGSPDEVTALLLAGEADIGIATESLADAPDLVCFPFHRWHHAVVVPVDHPLTRLRPLTLAALAEHPLITYHHGFTGRGRVDAAFEAAGLAPQVVLSALDSDVLKAYVELGLGAGIITPSAFDPRRDAGLALLDGAGLFPESTSLVAVRRGQWLRGYALHFVQRCCPQADLSALNGDARAAAERSDRAPRLPSGRPGPAADRPSAQAVTA
jgi:LysR family transcriptional regulator, cys regulon transcriptional activator